MAKPDLWSEDEVDISSLNAPVETGSDEWRLQHIQRAYCYDLNYHRRHVAVQLARQRGYKLSQITILYILSMGMNIRVIVGSNSLKHLEDMADLGEIHLDEAARLRLHRAVMASHSHDTYLP